MDLRELSKLKNLQVLMISDTVFGEPFLRDLAALKSLRKLTLDASGSIDDAGAAHLARLSSLETLEINSDTISDAALRHILELRNVRHLQLCGTQFTNNGLKHIAQMKKLTSLNLSGNRRVTADGVAHLTRLPDLAELDLCYLKLSDDAVPHLVQMKKLRHLGICDNKFSADGLTALRKALPGCEIHVEPRRIDDD